MAIATRILNDTPKNCRVHISGFFTQNVLDDKPVVVLDIAKLKDVVKELATVGLNVKMAKRYKQIEAETTKKLGMLLWNWNG